MWCKKTWFIYFVLSLAVAITSTAPSEKRAGNENQLETKVVGSIGDSAHRNHSELDDEEDPFYPTMDDWNATNAHSAKSKSKGSGSQGKNSGQGYGHDFKTICEDTGDGSKCDDEDTIEKLLHAIRTMAEKPELKEEDLKHLRNLVDRLTTKIHELQDTCSGGGHQIVEIEHRHTVERKIMKKEEHDVGDGGSSHEQTGDHEPSYTHDPLQANPNHGAPQGNPNYGPSQTNPNHVPSQVDPNHGPSQTNPNHGPSQADPNHGPSQANPNHVPSQVDSNHVASQANPNHVVSQADSYHAASQADSKHVDSQADSSHVLPQVNSDHPSPDHTLPQTINFIRPDVNFNGGFKKPMDELKKLYPHGHWPDEGHADSDSNEHPIASLRISSDNEHDPNMEALGNVYYDDDGSSEEGHNDENDYDHFYETRDTELTPEYLESVIRNERKFPSDLNNQEKHHHIQEHELASTM